MGVSTMRWFINTITKFFLNKFCFFLSIFLSEFSKFADERPVLEFAQVPFNHPLFIMYSSGTTGPPKCMVHSVGVSRKPYQRGTNSKVKG